MNKQVLLSAAVGTLTVTLSAGASANLLDPSVMQDAGADENTTSVDVGFADVSIRESGQGTPDGDTSSEDVGFAYKDRDGVEGFGTTYSPDGEMGGKNESIFVDYGEAGVIGNFTLAFLWPEGLAHDAVDEIAKITAFSNSEALYTGTLTAMLDNGTAKAEWSVNGETRLAKSVSGVGDGEAAAWFLRNPFGESLVDAVNFGVPEEKEDTKFSDYAISSVAVPNPAALGLLGLGLLGIAGFRRFSGSGRK